MLRPKGEPLQHAKRRTEASTFSRGMRRGFYGKHFSFAENKGDRTVKGSLKIVAWRGLVPQTGGVTSASVPAPKRKPKRVTSAPPPADLSAVAFVTDAQAAAYLGVSIRAVRYLVEEGKLKRVYPRPRSARITAESLTEYRRAIEEGRPPRIWTQPGNVHTPAPAPEPAPAPAPEKKRGLFRWGLGGD